MLDDRTRSLTDRLEQLHARLDRAESVEQILSRVATLATQAVPGCDQAGVTLRADDELRTAASTPEITELDAEQYTMGEGPCLAALRTGATHEIPSVDGEERWPEYVAAAERHGVTSVLSLPLTGDGDDPFGVLNLYSTSGRPMRDGRELAEVFARQAAVAVDNARTHLQVAELVEQLQQAIDGRGVIEQAKGIIMATRRVSADEAFDLLRRTSQESNVKLRDVARRVVAETSRAS